MKSYYPETDNMNVEEITFKPGTVASKIRKIMGKKANNIVVKTDYINPRTNSQLLMPKD